MATFDVTCVAKLDGWTAWNDHPESVLRKPFAGAISSRNFHNISKVLFIVGRLAFNVELSLLS